MIKKISFSTRTKCKIAFMEESHFLAILDIVYILKIETLILYRYRKNDIAIVEFNEKLN